MAASSASLRFAGDGFDYRRPAGSAPIEQDAGSVDLTGEEDDSLDDSDAAGENHVIDLTADDSGYGASLDERNSGQRERQRGSSNDRGNHDAPRLPRVMDIIIDLDNGEEDWRPAPEPGSPEIQLISSHEWQRRHNHQVEQRREAAGDEVEFVRENALPEAEAQRRRNQQVDTVMDLLGTMNGRFTHLRAQVDRFNAQVNNTANRFRRAPVPPPRPHGSRTVRMGNFRPPALDFELVGFEIGLPGVRDPDPPPPTYDAPPQAPEGFTRSPQEEDVLVCPNCDDELCSGDDEVKKQVWLVKACGHVSLRDSIHTCPCMLIYV